MPPKKAASRVAASAKETVAKKAKAAAPNTTAKRASTRTKPTPPEPAKAKPAPKTKAAPVKPAEKPKPTALKRKASEDHEDAPISKKSKTKAVTENAAPRKIAKPRGRPARKEDDEVAIKPVVKKAAATKKAAPQKPKKALPEINTPPTQVLDIYVFGEGGSGELGLGSKRMDGKKVIDVSRPRLNPKLAADVVGVVQIAVGGMHCAALTKDNKIYTWGVNDQGALGRETPQEGKMEDLAAGEDSDSDDDDDDSGLNPSEAEPRPVDLKFFEEGTKFASLYASDSATFALTTTGSVYGWGTFRGVDGILGFREDVKTAERPILIPELKNIVKMSVGTNHALALDNKGKVFAWGAGEQNQLGRRIVARKQTSGLVPQEFGLHRKNIVDIGSGDYHNFAIDKNGSVRAWGLNTFGQTGVPKPSEKDDYVLTPTVVESLKVYHIKQITGGAHHTIACTVEGEVLTFGKMESSQAGVESGSIPADYLYIDGEGRRRYLVKPLVVPNIKGAFVATATDTCIAIDVDGKAHSWGFSGNYQTGQGSTEDIAKARWIDNTAVRGKRLVFAGLGGQFGVLGGVAGETVGA